MRVMPIWMDDRSVVGSSMRARADFAPLLPCSAAAWILTRFDATNAISDKAKNPLSKTSNRMTRISLLGMKGTRCPMGIRV